MERKARQWVLLVLAVLLWAITGAPGLATAQQKTELVDQVTFVNTGQKWSDAQNEAWKVVQQYWRVATAEALMEHIHSEYIGWGTLDPMPVDKPTSRLWMINFFNTRKTHITTIAPAGMKIHSNVAIAQYHYMQLYSDTDGKQKVEHGRWTDVLMKQDGKWVLIADHGGPNPIDND